MQLYICNKPIGLRFTTLASHPTPNNIQQNYF